MADGRWQVVRGSWGPPPPHTPPTTYHIRVGGTVCLRERELRVVWPRCETHPRLTPRFFMIVSKEEK